MNEVFLRPTAGDIFFVILYIIYKKLGKTYDIKEIHSLMKQTDNIKFDTNYELYQLLEDVTYLEASYNQLNEMAEEMGANLKSKFLSYPVPKEILEEWKKNN